MELPLTVLPPVEDRLALNRATVSLRCLPFRRAFFEELKNRAISSQELCRRQDWANLFLDVSRPQQARGGGPDGVVPPTPTPRSTGETGQDLLDNIFP